MAPTTTKRPRDGAVDDATTSAKKPRIASGPSPARAANGQPLNETLPMNFKIPEKPLGTTRIAAWNVASFKACLRKSFALYAKKEDADIMILSETKVNDRPVYKWLSKLYPHQYWSISATRGHAGTCILSRTPALSVSLVLPTHPEPETTQGRIVTLEFEQYYLVGTYVVNAGDNFKFMAIKEVWNVAFDKYIKQLDTKKPVVWAGDVNCAPTQKDLSEATKKWNKRPGYTKKECDAFKSLLRTGRLVDVWRDMNPDLEHYTFWEYRTFGRKKGKGWRLDMFILSERIREWVRTCEIRDEIYGASDHCPIVMDFCVPAKS